MHLDQAAAQLYGLDPDEFIAARTALVAQARAAKDRPLAMAIGALKKPTRSAWLVNLLVRGDAQAVTQLQALGDRLARAHQQADLAAMRAVGAERQKLVEALTRWVVAAGAERGYSVTEAVRIEVHGTLDAAVADPEALDEVQRGRVVKARVYSGFGFPLGMMPGAPTSGEATSGEPTSGEPTFADGTPGEAADPPPQRNDEQQRQQLQRRAAQQAVTLATDRLVEARAALAGAESNHEALRAALDRASQEVADLRAELRKAERSEERARGEATQASDDLHDARAAVQQAEQALAAAARALD